MQLTGVQLSTCARYLLLFPVLLFTSLTMMGCGLIFGGDQRVDNRSHDYTVLRLDREKSQEWRILPAGETKSEEPGQTPSGPTPEDTGDLAFEHRSSGAIISINSVCRDMRDASLEELSRYLMLGLNSRSQAKTREIKVDGVDALESTVEASMSQPGPGGKGLQEQPVRVQAVVLRKSGCTYDLMYIARPDIYDVHHASFERFLKGFHAR